MADQLPAALVVIHSFGAYKKGELIVDAAAIKSILSGGMASFAIPTVPLKAPEPAGSGG